MTHDITAQQAYDWLTTGEAVLIDVREPDEFKAEHITYAISLPLACACGTVSQLKLPAQTKIIFQCLKGSRGGKACAAAQTADNIAYDVYNLEGGIEAWKEAGFPVVGISGPRFSIFRQVQIVVGSLIAFLILIGFFYHPAAFVVAGLFAAALSVAGMTGWCGLAIILGRMPWNK